MLSQHCIELNNSMNGDYPLKVVLCLRK